MRSKRPTWTAPVGVAGVNGFGWGQLSHMLSWIFKVTQLEPAEAFAFLGRSQASGADLSEAAALRCTSGATLSISGTALVPGVQGVGKQIDIRIFGTGGMLTYTGDDSDPDSGQLVYTSTAGESEKFSGGFLFEDTGEEGTGPASIEAFLDGCQGYEYYEGASAECGRSVVRALEAMYKSGVSGQAESC
eukprot:SAG22_NODE_4735_length_1179_cov_0.962963_1_plen_189_part_00